MRTAACLIFLLLSGSAFAQASDSLRVPMDPRLSELPYYSYSRGLGFTTPDSAYSLNLRFRLQARAANSFDETGIIASQWAIRRLRLRLDGFAFSPRITYAIQLSFATDDASQQVGEYNLNLIRDAVVFYRVLPELTLGFGQTKLPGNRQRVNSSSALQLVDRSIANAAFTIDRDFGFFAVYRSLPANQTGYILRGAVSSGKGRNWSSYDGYGLCYTGRAELYPTGAFTNEGVFFEGDLEREQRPKIMLGFTWSFNDNAIRTRGQLGDLLPASRDMRSAFADFLLKYRGWAFSADYMYRGTYDPLLVNPADSGLSAVLTGSGWNFQGSYLFRNNLEVVARYSRVDPEAQVSVLLPAGQEMRLGVNKYLRGHSLKLQMDGGWNTSRLAGAAETGFWDIRFQLELGI